MRIVLASLAVLVMFVGMVAGGYVYINRVAAGIGRVPVMFAPAHVASAPARTGTRSRACAPEIALHRPRPRPAESKRSVAAGDDAVASSPAANTSPLDHGPP